MVNVVQKRPSERSTAGLTICLPMWPIQDSSKGVEMWHDLKTSSICLSYSTCNLHEGLLFLFFGSSEIWRIFKPSQTISGDTNSFHPDLVWPFWCQFWPGSWVHDFIWRWVCNQVEDLTKHAKGSRKDACRNTSILHRNSEIGTLKQHGNKSSISLKVNWSTFI